MSDASLLGVVGMLAAVAPGTINSGPGAVQTAVPYTNNQPAMPGEVGVTKRPNQVENFAAAAPSSGAYLPPTPLAIGGPTPPSIPDTYQSAIFGPRKTWTDARGVADTAIDTAALSWPT